MSCKEIQELLKSDYLDGELDPAWEKAVAEHLLKCPACRELEGRLKAHHEILQSAKKDLPPEYVWQNIRRAITTEGTTREYRVHFMPRPVFILATALTAIICVVVLTSTIVRNQFFYGVNGDDTLAVYTLNGEAGDSVNDLGTTIEDYFL